MIVFGDSISDAGRRFNAPASFDYPGIGKFPFERLFEDADSDVSDIRCVVRRNKHSFTLLRWSLCIVLLKKMLAKHKCSSSSY